MTRRVLETKITYDGGRGVGELGVVSWTTNISKPCAKNMS